MKDSTSLRADALLAAQDRPKDAPFFIEATFAYKLRRDRCRAFKPKRDPPDAMRSLVLRREWNEVLARSGLSTRERGILAARIAGDSFEAIAIVNGTSRQAVHKAFRRIAAKVVAAYESYPFAGLGDVYLCEIRRGSRTQNGRHTSD